MLLHVCLRQATSFKLVGLGIEKTKHVRLIFHIKVGLLKTLKDMCILKERYLNSKTNFVWENHNTSVKLISKHLQVICIYWSNKIQYTPCTISRKRA